MGGGITDDPNGFVVGNSDSMTEYTVFKNHVWIRMQRASQTVVAIINIETYQFVKFFVISNSYVGSVCGTLSITDDGCLGYVDAVNNVLYVVVLTLDAQWLPIGGIPTTHSISLGYGGNTGQRGASLYTDGEFFYTSTTPSGTQCRNAKRKLDRVARTFTELVAYTSSGAPNPVPYATAQRIVTLGNGIKALLRYHTTNATNGSYYELINLGNFTQISNGMFNNANQSPLFDGLGVYYGEGNSPYLPIGSSYYVPYYKLVLNEETGGFSSTTKYSLANPPSTKDGLPSLKVRFNGAGIANKNGMYITKNSSNRFLKMERVYNLLNYSKEV